MTKVPRVVAEKDVESWLDIRKFKKKKRLEKKDQIDSLIDAIEDGSLSIDTETGEIKQVLDFSIENSDGKVTVKELVYKPRLTLFERDKGVKGIKGDDVFGMLLGYVSALTGIQKGILKHMDTSDGTIAQNIALLFM